MPTKTYGDTRHIPRNMDGFGELNLRAFVDGSPARDRSLEQEITGLLQALQKGEPLERVRQGIIAIFGREQTAFEQAVREAQK